MARQRLHHLAVIAAAAGAVSALGCNAVFDIHERTPWPGGCTDPLMIDDMEDGNDAICDSATRHGTWFTASDGTSSNLQPAPGETFAPALIPGGRAGSRYGAHMTGTAMGPDVDGWGSLMGFNLNVLGTANQTYNANAAGGIRFWMKSNVAVAIVFPVPATIPGSAGGTCADSAEAFNCNNHFQFLISPRTPDEWVEYDVPFAALAQALKPDAQGNAVFGSVAWNPTSLIGIEFEVPPVLSARVSFDVWVDDIRFYSCSDASCRPTCTDPDRPVACPAAGGVPAGCWPAGAACATVPVLEELFAGIWGSGAGDIWTVAASRARHVGAAAHWNGATWSIVPGGAAPTPLFGVWGSGAADVWAVGDRGGIVHWNGSAWSAMPGASGTTESLQGVWGSGADDVWAVGHGGTILRWNGSAWADVSSPTTLWLFGISGSGPADAWAVGASETDPTGVIVHWDGSAWVVVPSGAPRGLFGVWSNGPDDAWAVGDGVVHWDGSDWVAVASPTDGLQRSLSSVWGSGRDDVWAVGEQGTIIHWTGGTWSDVASSTSQDLWRVWGSGPDDVWAVGDQGTIIHWTGTAWSVIPASAIH